MRRLLPIVEGHGEIPAVPILIRNILATRGIHDVQPLSAWRHGEYPSVAKKFDSIFLAAIKENAPILWVMDFDSKDHDCPVKEEQNLLARAESLRPGWPIKIAFLVKEYETLFLIDETATRKVFPDIPAKTSFPENPENIRGAKEWLSKARPSSGSAYKETVHQAKITAHLNFELLRARSSDFAHLERAVVELANSAVPL
ncbi:hypothetical protein AT959_18570 [Dechloromonas denitrificans]|uniref:DUF4276 family protein n=1 Tax=Dechloromonas denitrificans TaxID=281362 RepID=A0A133XE41_9RHOO|nr:DUF4276 family protein [Dechloromonas denitrificans]KXB29191.1 hypothetical protein AT959_18570 [Dechloromonas denitrificans]